MTRAVILVPRRDDGGHRDALWAWTKGWWEREQSHMPIVEGYHVDGLFSRSAAINRAARLAGDWDVAVIIDADVICDPDRVKEAVVLAAETGQLVLPHDERRDLSPKGSRLAIAAGGVDDGRWDRHVSHVYREENGHPSVSSVIVVPRALWDELGGFDETFRGWGFEDTAFAAAAQTFGGIARLPGIVWHFWHPTAREGKRGTESWSRNSARGQRYRTAIGDRVAIRALIDEGVAPLAPLAGGIPRVIHRVVPEQTTAQAEAWWAAFDEMHPDWELRTHRDPLDPADWPLTRDAWPLVANGAQFADLIRLEALIRWGGVYVDQDVEPLRPLDPLLAVSAFAAWEDERCVPNAVLGAVPDHPAIRACLALMLDRLPGPTWEAGPGVLTAVLPGRPDVLLLPPGSFYPVHYRDPQRERLMTDPKLPARNPWAFVVHHYWGSWL